MYGTALHSSLRARASGVRHRKRMDSRLPQQLNNLLREGSISQVDHASARCRVRSGQVHTDLIPWLTPAAGGVRVWAPPSVGEQVLLLCVDGDLANAIALRGLFCDAFPAPSSSPDLTLIQFADGATVAYDSAAHALAATLPTGGTVSIVAEGGVRITGPVTIAGDVTVSGAIEASDDVVGGGISLMGHTHRGVQPGSGNTGAPQ